MGWWGARLKVQAVSIPVAAADPMGSGGGTGEGFAEARMGLPIRNATPAIQNVSWSFLGDRQVMSRSKNITFPFSSLSPTVDVLSWSWARQSVWASRTIWGSQATCQ